jgi:hypothetical protein
MNKAEKTPYSSKYRSELAQISPMTTYKWNLGNLLWLQTSLLLKAENFTTVATKIFFLRINQDMDFSELAKSKW